MTLGALLGVRGNIGAFSNKDYDVMLITWLYQWLKLYDEEWGPWKNKVPIIIMMKQEVCI